MKNTIRNKSGYINRTNKMNDEDYIKNILLLEEDLMKKYLDSCIKASNNNLYKNYRDLFDEISTIQRKIYNFIFKKGWIVLKMEKERNIMKKINLFEQKIDYLEKNSENK